jgi:hypothetical protein
MNSSSARAGTGTIEESKGKRDVVKQPINDAIAISHGSIDTDRSEIGGYKV